MGKTLRDEIREWLECDSISKKEELYDALDSKLCKRFRELEKIGDPSIVKLLKDYDSDNDYRSDRGCLALDEEDSTEYRIYFRYSDHWAYGGECDFSIGVPVSEAEKWFEDGALDKAKIASWKARIASNKAQIARNEEEIARLKLKNTELAKDCREVNALLYDAEGMKDKTFFLLHKWDFREEWDLNEVGKRRDGTTWIEHRATYASLEEAKLKLAVEGKTARVLKEDWSKEAYNFRIGIGIFSYEQLCTVASDPL